MRLRRALPRGALWPALGASLLLHLSVLGVWFERPLSVPRSAQSVAVQLVAAEHAAAAAPTSGPRNFRPRVLSSRAAPLRAVQPPDFAHPRALPPALTRPPAALPEPLPRSAGSMTAGVIPRWSESDYVDLLTQWLARHRQYPRAARRAGLEGEVQLGFVLGPDGRPREVRILRPSGVALLDRAALALLARATPLPWPAQLKAARIEVQVPVRYRLLEAGP